MFPYPTVALGKAMACQGFSFIQEVAGENLQEAAINGIPSHVPCLVKRKVVDYGKHTEKGHRPLPVQGLVFRKATDFGFREYVDHKISDCERADITSDPDLSETYLKGSHAARPLETVECWEIALEESSLPGD